MIFWPELLFSQDALGDRSKEGKPPQYSEYGADLCLQCHGEGSALPVLSIFKTRHAETSDARTPLAGLECESCHGPGALHPEAVMSGEKDMAIQNFGPGASTSIREQNQVCENCHNPNIGMVWHGSTHEQEAVSCASCHRIHAERDPVFNIKDQPKVCFTCHQQKRADSFKASTHPIRYGKMACTACHQPHGSNTEFELIRQTLNETCYSCHSEKRGPFLWEHAPASEDCTLCHQVHGSNHPSLLSKRPPFLCQQCHSQAGHPSVSGLPNGLPPSGGSALLLARGCMNCHTQVHGSNHPSGARLTR